MGRKAKFTEGNVVKKGPGRKAKKQGEPIFPKHLTDKGKVTKPLSRKQKQRALKRAKKREEIAEKRKLAKETKAKGQKSAKELKDDEELKLNIADRDVFKFPTEEERKEPIGLQDVQRRIKEVVEALQDFKTQRKEGR
ncbi:hypothetical protein C0J52_07842 [Blattella germanica]|nr:hypothetical protein C0J52_07842 [Blattella germanica]